MEHLSAREKNVLGETILINSNLFYDSDKKLVKDKKIMIYVMDTAEKREKEISLSNAMLGINLPSLGQVTQVTVPFKTQEEEERKELLGVVPFNWAALCLHIETNQELGVDELVFKRLNGLSIYKPDPVKLCGTSS